jgi:hypothetical protein
MGRVTMGSCTKNLNRFRKAYLVIGGIGRVVDVLQEHVSNTAEPLVMSVWSKEHIADLQPLRRSSKLSGRNGRSTVSLEIVLVEWSEQ